MHKRKSTKKAEYLSKQQAFWNDVVADVDGKIAEAKQRLAELESAKAVFKRNAVIGAPIPGEGREVIAG